MSRASTRSVSELMQTRLITLLESAPIEEAVETFEEYKISGAPVVDSAGNPVGVLSAFDIARAEHVRDGRIESGHGRWYLADPLFEDDSESDMQFDYEGYSPQTLERPRVGDWMTRKLVTIKPEASLKEACTLMTEHCIHRVLVVSERRLCGIVTSFDIVRHIAGSSES